jgi:hypothetical protein
MWNLDIGQLRQAAQRCVAEKVNTFVWSAAATPPLGGLDFRVGTVCVPVLGGAGCTVSLLVKYGSIAKKSLCPTYKFQVGIAGGHLVAGASRVGAPIAVINDFFQLGVISGRWDAAAVAAKGLPASADLAITLTVFEVAHMQHVQATPQARVGQQRL